MSRLKGLLWIVIKITADNLTHFRMGFLFALERISERNFPLSIVFYDLVRNLRYRGWSHIRNYWKDSRSLKLSSRRNWTYGLKSGPCFILDYDGPKGLQRKIVAGHFLYQFAIEPTEAELDILCCFSSLSWLSHRLLDLADCPQSFDLPERTLLRCCTVYLAYIQLLAMELELFHSQELDSRLFKADKQMRKRLKTMERKRQNFSGETLQAWRNFHWRRWEIEKIEIDLLLVEQTFSIVTGSKDVNNPANMRVINTMEETIYGKLD